MKHKNKHLCLCLVKIQILKNKPKKYYFLVYYSFLKLIYNCLALPLLFIYSKLMVLTNDKVKHRVEFANSYLDIPPKKNKRIMIHASSMGEFEQVKYLVEIIRKSEPDTEVIISFFSPSIYMVLSISVSFEPLRN